MIIGIIDATKMYAKDNDIANKNKGNFKNAKKNVKNDVRNPFFVCGMGEKGLIS